jgi:hypothetical protein
LRILLTGENGFAGVLSVNDSNFGLDLTSRGGLSSNPLIGIKGSLTQSANLSGRALAASPAAARPTVAPARAADDPKGVGRRMRLY